jgi:hypothetical protein
MKKLIYIATGQPVKKGDIATTFRGESAKVLGWALPRTPESTGRVHLVIEGAAPGWAEYYPSVINAEWREETNDACA